ncbi:cobyric acid synthase CobQ [Methanobrevibacter curvatus]|nr:cobyric acid synthase CobQ [Methanobrevibacter curvatus]
MTKKTAKCIMVQGTSSNAGKSVLVAALSRIYSKRGFKVAPFKSQNMSLNSYTTKDKGEIAIAQMFQAEACGIEPSVDMNPILLKPKGNFISQVIIQGKAVGDMNFYDYQHKFRDEGLKKIKESLDRLKEEYEIIFIEGAGSPAEINMRNEDMANMEIAHLSDSDVLLIADIDRGGVFASIAGTYSLLDETDRNRLKGVVINKFSGNLDILQPGIDKIEKIIKNPILGVLPYDKTLHLPEEDSASLNEHNFQSDREIIIGVLRLPKIANFTDIDPFEFEEDVGLKIIELDYKIKGNLENIDALIIPGTRSSSGDMVELKITGTDKIIKNISKKIPIVGICGGYQILGKKIVDEEKKESSYGTVDGIGLLDIETRFERSEKKLEQSKGIINKTELFKNIENELVTGYEIHEAISEIKNSKDTIPFIKIINEEKNNAKKDIEENNNKEKSELKNREINEEYDGAIKNNVFGTYFHGIFHNYNLRRSFLNNIRKTKGLKEKFGEDPYEAKKSYSIDKLAQIVEENLDMNFIDDLIFKD